MIISVNRLSLSTFRLLTRGTSLLLLFSVVFSCVDRVSGTDYTLTTRVKPTEAVFDGKTYTQLTSDDKLIVTANAAQIYLTGASATLDCNVDVSGQSFGSEKTGKIRMQMSSAQVANFNGTVNLVGDTYIGSHGWQSNQGTLYFNSQITGAGALIVAPGRYSVVHLNNTTSANNYQGNTQIGSTDMYNNSGNTNYGGTIILDADEQIPDALTVGASCAGNLVMMSWADGSDRLTSTLNLNGHTETVNGLVSADHLSVITGDGNSKLIVGANNASSEFGGIIQGAMQLQKIGSGTLTLSGASTYTGATTISEGTVKVTAPGTLGTGTATIASGATVEIATSETPWTWGGGVINGDGTLKVTGSGSFVITPAAMQISNDGKLIVDGASVTLNNDSSTANADYSGAEIFINNGGTVTFARSGSRDQFWISKQTTITFDENGGGTFNAGDNHSINLVNNSQTRFVTKGGATNYIKGASGFNLHGQSLTFDVAKGTSESGIDLELSARLWNNQGVIKNGPGTMSITCNNTNNGYRGKTEINAGTLVLAGNGTFGAGTSAITVASGATLKFAADLVNTTIANPISGAGTIVKDGTNTVTLTGTNTYTGDVTINGGSLAFLMDGTNKNLNVKKVSGSGDLVLRLAGGNYDTRLPNLVNNGFAGTISLVQEGGASGNKINSNGQTFEGFTFKVNPGTSIYIQGNEFKADVLLAGSGNSEGRGALRIANTVSGTVTVMSDAAMGFDGSRTVSGNIVSGAESGEVTLQLKPYDASGAYGTFTGSISDGDTGSKLGIRVVNGTQHVLSGNLSYTGATTVDSGKGLNLTGANTSLANSRAVNVNGTLNFTGYTGAEDMQFNNLTGTNGAIVGTGKNLKLSSDTESAFSGTIDVANLTISSGGFNLKGSTTGGITVGPNAVFSPGNSAGKAEVGGTFTLAADSSKLVMELGGTDPTQNDILIVSGDLALNDGKVFLQLAEGSALKGGDSFTAVLSGLNSADLADDFIANYVSSPIFTDLAYSQLTTGEFAGLYAITGSLDSNAIPEPATWALLALGVFGLLWGRCFQRCLGKNITDA